ncbi:MAG: hypothetical protein HIU90_08415 [Proteobacteria bacterium]|nr:hypothetical protein [Pseudomonadota bacterium]
MQIERGALDADTLARLVVIAENPLAPPSHRVRARTALRRHREAVAAYMGDEAVALDLIGRIERGEPLAWRDRATAVRLGLIKPVAD